MTSVLITGISIFVFFIVTMCGLVAKLIVSMARAKLVLMDDEDAVDFVEMAAADNVVDPAWADANGFDPEGAFRIRGVQGEPSMIVWTKQDNATYLCLYVLPTGPIKFEFVTIWNNGALTTGVTKDSHCIPPAPEFWVQSFDATDAATLWPHHEAGMKFLTANDLSLKPKQPNLETDFAKFMHCQSEYIRSLPMWPLRIPFWYFVRGIRFHNRPVQELMGQVQ